MLRTIAPVVSFQEKQTTNSFCTAQWMLKIVKLRCDFFFLRRLWKRDYGNDDDDDSDDNGGEKIK